MSRTVFLLVLFACPAQAAPDLSAHEILGKPRPFYVDSLRLRFSHFGCDRNEVCSDRGRRPFGAETRDVGRNSGAHFQNGYPYRGHIPSAGRVFRHQRE